MDTGIILTGIIICVIIIVPILIFGRLKKGKHKTLKQNFINHSTDKGLTVDELQVINDLLIAIDKSREKLVCANRLSIEKTFQIIDLKDISKAKVLTETDENTGLQKVSLKLRVENKDKIILFYQDSNDKMPERNYLTSKEDAEKWQQMLADYFVK